MKKLIGFIMALVFAVLLTSCDDEITHQDVFDSISIISSENKNSITEDFSFQYEVIDSVVIIFESNNEEVIKIIDNEAIVNRPNVDTTVNVEVKISIDNKTKDFSIEFTVLKQVILDKTPPVITGAKDFIYTIGDAAPNYLNGVSAIDDIDGAVLVTVDDSLVDLTKQGKYAVVFIAVDKAGNESKIVKNIQVNEKLIIDEIPPVIMGLKDITHIIGDPKPNYLEGVTAIDDIDGEVTVIVNVPFESLNILGKFAVFYTAVDTSGNSITIEKMVTVIEKQQTDETPPVITGTGNFTYIIGDKEPNYLLGVSASDDVDGEVEVTVDVSEVLLDTPGQYEIIYSAVDLSGNLSEIKRNVTVVLNIDVIPPVITGTKDFIYTIGEQTPNYLSGVKATDNKDGVIDVLLDNSFINLEVPGIYPIFYKAIDSSGNETVIEQKITVSAPGSIEEFIVETFDNLESGSSSYTEGNFVGVSGLLWTYTSSRTDQKIDGNALTFSDKAEQSKLKVILPGGISSFSLDATHAFSGNSIRQISLYINNIEIAIFDVTSTVQTFKVENLGYQEEVVLEIRNTGQQRVTIDNINLGLDTTSEEEKHIKEVLEELELPLNFISNSEIELKITFKDVNISWSYLDEENINNQYLDINSGLVTIPENDLIVQVSIVATLTYGEEVRTKTFVISIGEGEPISILEVRLTPNNIEVKTTALVTYSVFKDNRYYAYLEDETAGIFVISELELTKGNLITFKGLKETIDGAITLTNIKDIKIKETQTINISVINLNQVNSYLGRHVQVEGYLQNNTTTNETSFEIITLAGSTTIILPSYIDSTELQNMLESKSAGTKVIIEGFVYKNGVIHLLDKSHLYIEDTISNIEVSMIILNDLEMPSQDQEIVEDLNLPTKSLKFNATIKWMSSNNNVLTDEGTIIKPNEDTAVTLYYEIKIGSNVVKADSIDVIVISVEELMAYYSAASGLTGSALKIKLNSIIRAGRRTTSYDEAISILQISDRDPNNPNNILLVYDRSSIIKTWGGNPLRWNREHVWPQSKLGSAPKGEIHNLKPSDVDINSSRGNYPFVNGSGSYGRVGNGWYPGDEDRGDIARIIFYMVTYYTDLKISTMGSANVFKEWHILDPVDDFERNRNDVIYGYTNNRNPYIDHPHFVDLINW